MCEIFLQIYPTVKELRSKMIYLSGTGLSRLSGKEAVNQMSATNTTTTTKYYYS